jgi:hypothetical protein
MCTILSGFRVYACTGIWMTMSFVIVSLHVLACGSKTFADIQGWGWGCYISKN